MPLAPDTRVLITAGAGGIGRAMGEAFAAAGARVWVTDIAGDALAAGPEGWRKTCLDVTDEPAMAALFAEIEAEWGGLDTLCANAGVAGPTALVEDIALEDWRASVSVRLEGAFLAAKSAAPTMTPQGAGPELLTLLSARCVGFPPRPPCPPSHRAVGGVAHRREAVLGPHGIRANALCPGAVEGPRMEAVMAREAAAKGLTRQEIHDAYASGTSMRTWVTGEDIANMAVFLASPEARYVPGQVLAVAGHPSTPDPTA